MWKSDQEVVARNVARLRDARRAVLEHPGCEMEPITAEMVEEAAKSFPATANEGIDGWRVKSALGHSPSASADVAALLRACSAIY